MTQKISTAEQKKRGKNFTAHYHFSDILTEDIQMQVVRSQAGIYAQTDSTVLIQGESGTGKELFAQSIHNGSSRKDGPFVAVNCAAIPVALLESELFGYEKGAFTGANKEGKAGFFEMAQMGTLFLDEIGEITPEIQTRLLRVLQEKEIMRVGGNRIIPVNVRIICATNRNLREEVKKGNFREDLYYRLNVLELSIPPLRERPGDIRLLAEHFSRKYRCSGKDIRGLVPLLEKHQWPGNVRELQNIVERYCTLLPLRQKGRITEEKLVDALQLSDTELHSVRPGGNTIPFINDRYPVSDQDFLNLRIPFGKSLAEMVGHVEYLICKKYLQKYNNNQEKAADALGIGRTTLWRKSRTDPVKEVG